MYCKRLNQHPPSNKCYPLQGQNNFAQLLANIHDTPDMRVPKKLTITGKNKQKKLKPKTREKRKRDKKTRNKRKGK